MQTNTEAYANSADPDEMAHNEPSHQDLLFAIMFLCLYWNSHFQWWTHPNSKTEETTSDSGVKGLTYLSLLTSKPGLIHFVFKGDWKHYVDFSPFLQGRQLWLPDCIPGLQTASGNGSTLKRKEFTPKGFRANSFRNLGKTIFELPLEVYQVSTTGFFFLQNTSVSCHLIWVYSLCHYKNMPI